MPVYKYVARSESGVDISGALFALNEEALFMALRKQGLFLLKSRKRLGKSMRADKLRIPTKQLLSFTIHLSTYQQAGISLMQTLSALSRESTGVKFQALIEGLITRLSGGSSFSDALASYPRIFDGYYIQMVVTGEASGQLEKRLDDLVKHLEWQQEIRSQVKQSSTYPLVIMGLLALVTVMLMTFTLPKFIVLLKQFGGKLPMPTRIVIAMSAFLSHYWFFLPIFAAIPYGALRLLKSSPKGRLALDRFKLRVPIFGNLHRKIAMSRFAHHFSCLNAAGIDTLSALTIIIGKVINRACQAVSAGRPLSQELSQSREFPPFVIQMLSAGEESGNLDGTLRKVAEYFDREIPAAIKRAFTIIEPAALVTMGGVVAFIALSILLPIYEFSASVNK
jgi:type IV pilus assembly protein PilC